MVCEKESDPFFISHQLAELRVGRKKSINHPTPDQTAAQQMRGSQSSPDGWDTLLNHTHRLDHFYKMTDVIG
jgi:hypothetical protein